MLSFYSPARLPWQVRGTIALAAILAVFPSAAMAQIRSDAQWSASLQSGLADTFQLTLGGMFGGGPALQNKLTAGMRNAFRSGDFISVYGWESIDVHKRDINWQAGFGYQTVVFKRRGTVLSLGSGVQHWRFPNVKTGTHDWLIPGNLTFQNVLPKKFSLLVTQDSWSLLKSPLPTGSLLHTQVWVQRTLFRREKIQIALKHGPAHTYSWNFYGAQGNRVFRYQSMLAITSGKLTIEGGFRKQVGLQDGIQDNNYWQFSFSRSFSRPLANR